MSKLFTIIRTNSRTDREYLQTGTLDDLVQSYSYTLEKGASYEHEKGNKKINKTPTTIASLVTNLNNAVNNAARDGNGGEVYRSL